MPGYKVHTLLLLLLLLRNLKKQFKFHKHSAYNRVVAKGSCYRVDVSILQFVCGVRNRVKKNEVSTRLSELQVKSVVTWVRQYCCGLTAVNDNWSFRRMLPSHSVTQ